MKDPSYAIQRAVFAALAASAGVKALLGDPARVHDKPPAQDDLEYPYARIGDDQVLGDSNGCGDGWEVYVTVHIYGRDPQAPRPEVKAISNAVTEALGDNDELIAPAGFKITEVTLVQARTFMEDDGLTAHGVVVMLYLVDEA